MKNGKRARCHLINAKPQRGGRGNHRLRGPPSSPRTHVPENEEAEGFKWAASHDVTHLSHSDDGARSRGGAARRLSLLGRLRNNTIHLCNTILQTPPT